MQKSSITTFRSKFFVSEYRKISLGNTSGYQKISGIEKIYASVGGGYHVSSSKNFCLTVPKNFVGEHFGVSEKFGYRKILCIREGGVSSFFVESFLSHSIEKFRWGTLRCFRKFRVSQKFMHQKGISLNSVENFLFHSADKIRRRTFLCFERILVSKIFKQRRGKLHGFIEIFFISQDRKNFASEPFCVSENFC